MVVETKKTHKKKNPPRRFIPLGTIVEWEDKTKPNVKRVMIKTEKGMEVARRYYYKLYNPNEDIKGYRIMHLDMNKFNFDKDNLIKVSATEFNCLLNNKLLSNNPNHNRLALLTIRNEISVKKLNKIVKEDRRDTNGTL